MNTQLQQFSLDFLPNLRLHRWLAATGTGMVLLGLIGLMPLVSYPNPQQTVGTPAPVKAAAAAPAVQNSQTSQNPAPARVAGNPVRLSVPAANIDITVIDGNFNYQTGEWTLTNDKAQFAVMSAEPNNQSGGTFIYGHNTRRVFAALHGLPIGVEAKLYTQNGHTFTYILRSSEVVKPDHASVLDYTGAPRLTLQTCTGVWSESRKFFHFDLVTAN